MSNKEFLIKYKNIYNSLQYFSIENESLILNYDKIYKMPLTHIKLNDYLNQNLYFLKPKEIFQVLFILELLYKKEITEFESNYIINYVKIFLSLKDRQNSLDINQDNSNYMDLYLNVFNIPIYTSYNTDVYNNPASILIQETINNHAIDIESGKGKGQRLVLTNPNFGSYANEDEDNLRNLEKAGFTTIILITSAIVITCLYVAFFIVGNS